jgi:hypothetical protein
MIINSLRMSSFLQAIYSEQNTSDIKEIHFLICESCFWCASLLCPNDNNNDNPADITITKHCPSCSNNRVESLPISYNEVYKFDYNPKRGVTLEFFTVHAQG